MQSDFFSFGNLHILKSYKAKEPAQGQVDASSILTVINWVCKWELISYFAMKRNWGKIKKKHLEAH